MLTSVAAAASVSTTAPVPTVAATTTTTTVSGHLSQAWVNLLLGLLEDINEITSLLGVYSGLAKSAVRRGCVNYSLSVVKKVMAVPS
jgi:hypothetical protein